MSDEIITPSYWSVALRYGLIFGMISVIIQLLMQISGSSSNPIITSLVAILSIGVGFAAAYMAVNNYKIEHSGGFISFGRAFLVGFITLLVLSLMVNLFSVVYSNFIDPDAIEQAVEANNEMMEKFGQSEEQIEAGEKRMRFMMGNPLIIFFSGFASYLFVSALMALIAAAILKRDD